MSHDSARTAAMAGAVRVRDGERSDLARVHRMIQELAEFEGMPEGPQISVDDLIKDGFESQWQWFFLVVAEMTSPAPEVVGYALCNRAYSSWTARAYYVEDLYVRPELRSRGVGRDLLRHVCRMGVREGVRRVDWHVLANNGRALKFYASLGAKNLCETEGRAAMRLYAPELERLARERPPPES